MKLKDRDPITIDMLKSTIISLTFAEVLSALGAITDGLFSARFLGTEGMAAYGLGFPFFSVLAVFQGLLVVGVQSILTNLIGKGKIDEAKKTFTASIIITFVIGALLSVFSIVFARQIATVFGARENAGNLMELTTTFIRTTALVPIPFLIYFVLIPVLQIDGDNNLVTLAPIVLFAVDATADYVFLKVLNLGIKGVAYSTIASYTLGAVVLLLHFLKKSRIMGFNFKALEVGKTLTSVFNKGLPRGLSNIFFAAFPIILNTIIFSVAGEEGLAAMAILSSTMFLFYSVVRGAGAGTVTVAGINVSEEDTENLKGTLDMSMRITIVTNIIIALLVFFLSPFIADMFLTERGRTWSMAVAALKMFALSIPFKAFAFNMSCYYQTIGKGLLCNIINICSEAVFNIVIALALVGSYGINGVWDSFFYSQVLVCLLIVAYTLISRDRSKKGIEALMGLRKDFGVSKENYTTCVPHSINEVVDFSEQVSKFCEEHGLSSKKTMAISLCVEEMGTNVFLHGFKKDNKKHHLDLKVVIKDERVVLRIRDDCKRFDFKDKMSSIKFDPDNPSKNVGVRLVQAMATDVSSTNAINHNTLLLII